VILEIVSVPLPLLVRVMVFAALAVPTETSPNRTVAGLIKMPAVEAEMSAVLPPVPQDVNHRAIVAQAAMRTILKSFDECNGVRLIS
jgi:hypothetical protein